MSTTACPRRRSLAAVCGNKKVVKDAFFVLLCSVYLALELFHHGSPLAPVWKSQSKFAALHPPSEPRASPLKGIVERLSSEPLSEEERQVLEDVSRMSNLELETVAVAETVVPVTEHAKLVEYVEKNLAGIRVVLGPERADSVVSMVRNYACSEDFVDLSSGAFDSTGSLATYACLLLVARQDDHLHFMLTAGRAEPHLGWRGISRGRRVQWRSALARSLTEKVIDEAKEKFAS